MRPDELASYGLDKLIRGAPTLLYHGTNRTFTRFNLDYVRHELIDKFYNAPGIFLTPRKPVAATYAWAARNASLPKTIVQDLIRANPDAGDILHRLVVQGGDAWDGLFQDAAARFPDVSPPYAALERMSGGVDPNTLMDIAGHIEGSAYGEKETETTLFELWGMSSGSGTPEYIFDAIDTIGLDSTLYRPKVYTVIVQTERVLVTASKTEAVNAKRNYDAVIFHGSDLVQGVPEVVVFNPDHVRVVKYDVV